MPTHWVCGTTGNLSLLKRAANKPARALPWKDILFLLFWSENKFALCPAEKGTLSSTAVWHTNIPEHLA